jgi:hypothetical protein
MNKLQVITVVGLLAGAAGIAGLWASGIVFPFYPPPGLLILTAGAILVAVMRFRWVPLLGTALGLFMVIGFLLSDGGIGNLTGAAGIGASISTVVQMVGVITAAVAGAAAVARPRVVNS